MIGLSPKDTLKTQAEVTSANEYYEKQGCFRAPNDAAPTDKFMNLFKRD